MGSSKSIDAIISANIKLNVCGHLIISLTAHRDEEARSTKGRNGAKSKRTVECVALPVLCRLLRAAH